MTREEIPQTCPKCGLHKCEDFFHPPSPRQVSHAATHAVLSEVFGERERQNEMWGLQHGPTSEWMQILMEEVGEAAKESNEHTFSNKPGALLRMRTELVQVAAVSVAIIEDIDTKLALEAAVEFEDPNPDGEVAGA